MIPAVGWIFGALDNIILVAIVHHMQDNNGLLLNIKKNACSIVSMSVLLISLFSFSILLANLHGINFVASAIFQRESHLP